MHAIAALGIYATAITVKVLIEETFCIENIHQVPSLRLKVHLTYRRYVNDNLHSWLYSGLNGLPLGITAYFIDEEGLLFVLGKLFFIDVICHLGRNDTNDALYNSYMASDNFGASHLINAKLLTVIHIVAYTVLINMVRAKGVKICNYLESRAPQPFDGVLARLKNTLQV